MSLDLFFFSPSRHALSEDEFKSYFQLRRHYTINDSQAFYENEDTGVYFAFEYGVGIDHDDLDPDDAISDACAIFNLNFFRPHVFAHEAIPEITAFTNQFHLIVSDGSTREPQRFDSKSFLEQWSAGNSLAYKSLRNNSLQPLHPSAEIERIWNWNLARNDYQNQFGESLYVPKIFFFRWEDRVRSGVVWPDAIPIALPQCDIIWAMRKEITPRSFFGLSSGPATDAIVPYTQLKPLLTHYPTIEVPASHFLLQYDTPPPSLVRAINNFPATTHKPEGLPPDQVLNQELWDSFLDP